MKCESCDNISICKNKCKSCYDKWYRSTDNGKSRRKLAQDKIREKESRKLYTKTYNKKYKKRRNILRNIRRKVDIQYKLSCILRDRLNKALKGNIKSGSAIKDLGCTLEQLKLHLESKFEPDMSWDNYGRKSNVKCWEIDHIIPISSFNLKSKKKLKKACNYLNLQPLWAKDNNKKRNKIIL